LNQEKFSEPGKIFLRAVWTELLGQRLDRCPRYDALLTQIAEIFERGAWSLLFDIWEGIFKCQPPPVIDPNKTAEAIREALARENAAYTFVGGRFVDRMRPEEVQLT